jgi:hypothetical protein
MIFLRKVQVLGPDGELVKKTTPLVSHTGCGKNDNEAKKCHGNEFMSCRCSAPGPTKLFLTDELSSNTRQGRQEVIACGENKAQVRGRPEVWRGEGSNELPAPDLKELCGDSFQVPCLQFGTPGCLAFGAINRHRATISNIPFAAPLPDDLHV